MPLLNSQYDSIMRHYDETRERHRHEQEAHQAQIERELPQYSRLDRECSHLSAEIARCRLRDPSADTAALSASLDDLRKQKKALLIRNGYPADYLERHYDCALCHDTGYIGSEKCRCFRAAAVTLLYRQYALDDILKEENFAHFNPELYSDTIKDANEEESPRDRALKAYEEAVFFTRHIGEAGNHLLILGRPGTGKTFLSHAIAAEAMKNGFSTLYFTSYDFFRIMADSVLGKSEEASSYGRLIMVSDLLLIDDLGAELTNTLVESEFFRIVNERQRRNLSTVISTNLSLNEISRRYTERIFSRLIAGSRIIELIGDDLRLKKKI